MSLHEREAFVPRAQTELTLKLHRYQWPKNGAYTGDDVFYMKDAEGVEVVVSRPEVLVELVDDNTIFLLAHPDPERIGFYRKIKDNE